jgi:hypothetical protein
MAMAMEIIPGAITLMHSLQTLPNGPTKMVTDTGIMPVVIARTYFRLMGHNGLTKMAMAGAITCKARTQITSLPTQHNGPIVMMMDMVIINREPTLMPSLMMELSGSTVMGMAMEITSLEMNLISSRTTQPNGLIAMGMGTEMLRMEILATFVLGHPLV